MHQEERTGAIGVGADYRLRARQRMRMVLWCQSDVTWMQQRHGMVEQSEASTEVRCNGMEGNGEAEKGEKEG